MIVRHIIILGVAGIVSGLLLGASLAPKKALPPFEAGTSVSIGLAKGGLTQGVAWSYRQGSVRLIAGMVSPDHVAIGTWQLTLAGHTNRPDAPLDVLLTYPVGLYSSTNTHWGKRFNVVANNQGNWQLTWRAGAQYLTNGKAGFSIVEYAPHKPPTVHSILLRTLTFFPMNFDRNHDLGGNNVIVGTVVHDNSPILSVAGTTFRVNTVLQARLYVVPSVQATGIELLVERRTGYAWQTAVSRIIPTQLNDTFVVQPFEVSQPGTYRVTFEDSGQVFASTTINVNS